MNKSDSNSSNKMILRLTLFEESVCEEFVFEELVQMAAAPRLHRPAAGKVFSSRAVEHERTRRGGRGEGCSLAAAVPRVTVQARALLEVPSGVRAFVGELMAMR